MIEQFLDYVMPAVLMVISAVIVAAIGAHLDFWIGAYCRRGPSNALRLPTANVRVAVRVKRRKE